MATLQLYRIDHTVSTVHTGPNVLHVSTKGKREHALSDAGAYARMEALEAQGADVTMYRFDPVFKVYRTVYRTQEA